jgi:hypothetical protein
MISPINRLGIAAMNHNRPWPDLPGQFRPFLISKKQISSKPQHIASSTTIEKTKTVTYSYRHCAQEKNFGILSILATIDDDSLEGKSVKMMWVF